MNVLILNPEQDALEYGFFLDGTSTAASHGTVKGFRTKMTVDGALTTVLRQVQGNRGTAKHIDAVSLRVAFGGNRFPDHVPVGPETVEFLESMIYAAPLHIPPVLELIRSCGRYLPESSLVLFFETAFFVDLPKHEYLYAINPHTPDLRRYGYHGLFHEAACAETGQQLKNGAARLVSICLEPHPEIAAVVDNRAVMVGGGATPLEGLPGHTSCGEIDSGLLLTLSRREQWGPEQINTLLTRKSGLTGLTGRPVTLPDVLAAKDADVRLAHDVILYRILLQTGMALAAMNGYDQIVFSGRYASSGRLLGPWLSARLPVAAPSVSPGWRCFEQTLMEIMAARTPAIAAAAPAFCLAG